jgi:hypothetical protein
MYTKQLILICVRHPDKQIKQPHQMVKDYIRHGPTQGCSFTRTFITFYLFYNFMLIQWKDFIILLLKACEKIKYIFFIIENFFFYHKSLDNHIIWMVKSIEEIVKSGVWGEKSSFDKSIWTKGGRWTLSIEEKNKFFGYFLCTGRILSFIICNLQTTYFLIGENLCY